MTMTTTLADRPNQVSTSAGAAGTIGTDGTTDRPDHVTPERRSDDPVSEPRSDHRVSEPRSDHREVNSRLFAERVEVRQRIARLEQQGESAANRSRLRRLHRRLEELTSEIVSENLGLVRSYTRRFGGAANADTRAEFESAGLLGLMRAVDSYEPDRGPFGQWAFKPIQREVLRAVRDRDHPNLNHGDFEKRPVILRTQRELRSIDDSYEPSFAEIAAAAGVTVAQVQRVLDPPRLDSISDQPAHLSDDGDDVGDTDIVSDGPQPDETVISGVTLAGLEKFALSVLDERELFVVVRRFGLDGEPVEKLNEIGDLLALSREAVRQIEAKALAKLQHPMVIARIGRPLATQA
ncbi:MAG: sigma-70 family RNA polymerase sigma factor [Actinomycetota bacterium]